MTVIDAKKLLQKLNRPPAGVNWVRLVQDNSATTAKEILKFLKGRPRFTYQPGCSVIKDRIELGVDQVTAETAVLSKGSPAGRIHNLELVRAFFDYDQTRCYSSSSSISVDTEYFRISRDIKIPVKPLTVIRENGNFVPIFICGWTKNVLSLEQRRLLMTIIEDSFLSLTDFQSSPAEVLFFPKTQTDAGLIRTPEIWRRGDYQLLSDQELVEKVEVFIHGRDLAESIIRDSTNDGISDNSDQIDIFNAQQGELFRV